MRLLVLFFFASSLFSCFPVKTIPIKGTYLEPPFERKSESSVNQVWDMIIDLFAQKGLPIKLVDKSSGLIVSDESELIWSYEDKNGNLLDGDASIVLSTKKSGNLYITPRMVTGEWNIRIKAEGNQTSININLVKIRAYGLSRETNTGMGTILSNGVDAKSTGKFEQSIFDMIK